MKYYFVIKEKTLEDRVALMVLACYRDLNFEVHRHWHEESITHPESERFNDREEAESLAEQFFGQVKMVPKEVYEWLQDKRRLDDES